MLPLGIFEVVVENVHYSFAGAAATADLHIRSLAFLSVTDDRGRPFNNYLAGTWLINWVFKSASSRAFSVLFHNL